MLFRSKTAIKVRFQKLFKTKNSSKSFSQLFNFSGITTVKTQKFSAIVIKLSNDLIAEPNDKIIFIVEKFPNKRHFYGKSGTLWLRTEHNYTKTENALFKSLLYALLSKAEKHIALAC